MTLAVRRENKTPESTSETARMPPSQASAAQGAVPTGVPSSSPRRDWVTGVIG